MKIRIDLRFWVDVAYKNIVSDHAKLTKRQLIAQSYDNTNDVDMRCAASIGRAKSLGKRVRDF